MPEFVDVGSTDFMSRSSILRRHGSARSFFDPTNEAHLASLKKYIETGMWDKNTMFFAEFPFTDAVMTVLMKFARHQLQVSERSVLGVSKEEAATLAAQPENHAFTSI
jgi:hypothetical protein